MNRPAVTPQNNRIIVIPSAFKYTTGKAHWHSLIKARAIENGVFILAPNQWGVNNENRSTYGHSLIVDPWGEILAEADDSEMIITYELHLNKVQELCNKNGWLLILDGVQSCMGRTGKLFAHEHNQITPDILCLAKGLGNGVPIGACLAKGVASKMLTPGTHGSTFGGNPLAAAVASKALDLLYDDNLIENSRQMGDYLANQLRAIDTDIIKEVRGKGLWIGVELFKDTVKAKQICLDLLELGILAKETHETVIRFAPPLIITKDQIDWALETIRSTFKSYSK